MIDSLTIALALLANDGRAMPLNGIEIVPTTFVMERTSNVSLPPETAFLDTREMIKVVEPSEITFKGAN